jgi:hypothetical protein
MTNVHDMSSRVHAPIEHPDVTILHWPDDAHRMEELARARRPRLLLVEPGHAPPEEWDRLTDWVRLPASRDDVETRAIVLQWRHERLALPSLDDDGMLRCRGSSVQLRPLQARLMAWLIAAGPRLVPRGELAAAGSVDGSALDDALNDLRRAVERVGARLHAARGRGYVLESTPSS